MLKRITDMAPGIDALQAVGKITKEDYEQVVRPMIDQARKEGRRIRFLYEFGPDCEGFTAGAAWEDAKVGLSAMRMFDGCAIVTDKDWIRRATEVAAFMMPCPVRTFDLEDRAKAVDWLSSLPQGPAVSHRLLPDSGVLMVEIKQPLRAEDFDALAVTVDTWIEAHGALNGIVIHAKEFPGWQNLGGLIHHLRFVRDHHRRVKKVALAADGNVAELAPTLAKHFVEAKIKNFDFDDLDDALAWVKE